ncbi:DNA methyltransferase [Luteimonas suaedae]|uniref:DNA methyltransferase n=1 Tax=Luteimonas suaedae TaxID=2605430 RepID=UPI0011F032C4|nr:DNA methyltransferase [Luteimonas suaedae]
MTDRVDRLRQFVDWCATHICGDEKGEAQIFLDQLFRAFGHTGVKEAGATFEDRVKKEHKGTAFADLVWKPVVLIEMKKRGTDLSKHYRQAFDYWTRLVPGRPRYVVLCNFDQFWVYDFETQMDSPVDVVALADLPERDGPLAFLLPEDVKPVFGNDQEQVTRDAADLLVGLFRSLVDRDVERELAQRFTLQALMALFAEDIGLLEKYFFARLLDDCTTPALAHDLIGQLFAEMSAPGITTGGRFKGVPYFNGGLFREPARVELLVTEVSLLRQAAAFDWAKVRPEIFGAIFEHSLGDVERHASGAHYTSSVDIMKIVGPTIVEPWREQIGKAKTLTALEALLARIERFRVLDPACGSGNFLYIAYRELKRLEALIYERMGEFKSVDHSQRPFGFVSSKNFYGLDINPFAVELAKVTMMLAHKLAIDELHISEKALPLDNLDANFIAGDALLQADGTWAPWPRVDVIVGNPPFLGAKRLKPELGVDYVNNVRKAYPQVPGMADFCVYWFHRAASHLPACTPADPLAGRAGLVGTQNIRNNASREGGLDFICATGTVVEAVDNQPWSGDANVHVSIANWVHTLDAALLPKTRRLWFKAAPVVGKKVRKKRGSGPASKDYELDVREVAHLNASLSDRVDLGNAKALPCNKEPKKVFQGVTPGHDGFVLTLQEKRFVESDGSSAEVVHPYLTGRELVTGDGTPERFIIDFQRRDLLQVQRFPNAFERIRSSVLPDRQRKADEGKDVNGNMRSHHKQFLERWWALSWDRKDLFSGFERLRGRFICCSRVTKRPIFQFLTTDVWPSDKVQAFLFDDDYSFGILQSSAHWQWFLEKCSKLKSDFSYSIESVFDTFPWPQSPSAAQIDAIADAGRELRVLRTQSLQSISGGLRALYRTLDLPGKNPLKDAHARLDTAVVSAYSFNPKVDLLEQLLTLNQSVAQLISDEQAVTAPGIPAGYADPARLVSADAMGRV